MNNKDTITRFLFEHADIRGEIVHLENSYLQLLEKHLYPLAVQKCLSELLLASVLLSASIKYQGRMTIEFKGDKKISLLMVKCNHLFQVRGLAQFDKTADDESLQEALCHGQLIITIEPDNKVQNYQSIVEVKEGDIAKSLAYYFAQSEQISTQLFFATDNQKAAGLLLQLMPSQKNSDLERETFWSYASKIGETITEKELLNLDNSTLLTRLYHETEIRLFPEKPVQFFCPCTKERMERAILTLGQKEANAVIKEEKAITVNCEFCLQSYHFDAVDVASLFKR